MSRHPQRDPRLTRRRGVTQLIHRHLILGLALLLAAPAAAVDGFYEQLLQSGLASRQAGDLVGAERQLEIACFGMLNEPKPLAGCLVQLSLTRADLEDHDGFLEAAGRLLAVERRFQVLDAVGLSPSARSRLEASLRSWASYEMVRGVASFQALAEELLLEQIRQLPVEERRRELDRRAAIEPERSVWRLMWAEAELESGDADAVAKALDELLVRGPSDLDRPAARCLRGQARLAGAAGCADPTADDLGHCAGERRPAALRGLLGCQVERGDWRAAQATLDELPEDVRDESRTRRLEREIRRGARTATVDDPSPSAPSTEPTVEEAISSTLPAAAAADGGVSTDRALLNEVRLVLNENRRDRYADVLPRAVKLADRSPDLAEAQEHVALLAFRLGRWEQAVDYFRRAGDVVSGRPELEFFYSISLFKTGEVEAARALLERALPRLRQNEYVTFWSERIRGTAG